MGETDKREKEKQKKRLRLPELLMCWMMMAWRKKGKGQGSVDSAVSRRGSTVGQSGKGMGPETQAQTSASL